MAHPEYWGWEPPTPAQPVYSVVPAQSEEARTDSAHPLVGEYADTQEVLDAFYDEVVQEFHDESYDDQHEDVLDTGDRFEGRPTATSMPRQGRLDAG